MTPPFWLDEHGQRQPTRRCWKCGSEVPISRYRAETVRHYHIAISMRVSKPSVDSSLSYLLRSHPVGA